MKRVILMLLSAVATFATASVIFDAEPEQDSLERQINYLNSILIKYENAGDYEKCARIRDRLLTLTASLTKITGNIPASPASGSTGA